ncbi:family 65 glycosyl hydrolase domain-containing protein [Bacteroidota bacterium]
MKSYYKVDPWSIIEEQFDPSMQKASESIFSLGNGRMGQRANFEETYSGDTLQGNYIAGVYYPDKTRVGWWKNGYPEFFAKVLNAPNYIDISVTIDGTELDLHSCEVLEFRRELNMRHGYLQRDFKVKFDDSREVHVEAKRFLSIVEDEVAAIKYTVTPLNFTGEIVLAPTIDGHVRNEDSNYDEMFWEILDTRSEAGSASLVSETRKSHFSVAFSMMYEVYRNDKPIELTPELTHEKDKVGSRLKLTLEPGESATIYKYVSVTSSMNYPKDALIDEGKQIVQQAFEKKFDRLFEAHCNKWEENWSHSDIVIGRDPKAQQAIRFNIFHLSQTYSGKDERLNIGPKGFTGEKYGGSTYWDTEAYLISFYLSSAASSVARNLLVYRYKHLEKAIENAELLGFRNGAALYPMVTMDGRECHNEWEITFEEIHRNGAIAYAIHNYIRYTGDKAYLAEYGLEVLIALSRFWRQRVNWSDVKGQYVMLGVTGPNEYENNVNNNWYTNLMAKWTLEYTIEALRYVNEKHPASYKEIIARTSFDENAETERWKDIISNLYFPYSEEQKVFLQQDGYMDKKQMFASDIDPSERPINQHWSWDRILRSPFIKQADVLQGLFFFEDDYDLETIKRNFEFYEPRTVHESSLSPCIHSILANMIGERDLAYQMYLRTSRLDLDDYNREVAEGLHITSMGGTWMSVVYGFGGFRVKDDRLHLNPSIPDNWASLTFKVVFRENYLKIHINGKGTVIENEKGPSLTIMINGEEKVVPEAAVSEFVIN